MNDTADMDTTLTAKHFETVEMVCAVFISRRYALSSAYAARKHYAFDDCVSRACSVLVERALDAWDGEGELTSWVKVITRRECTKELELHAYAKRGGMLDDNSARDEDELQAVSGAMQRQGLAKHIAAPKHTDLESADNARPNVRASGTAMATREAAPCPAAAIDGARARAALSGAVAGLTDAEQAFWSVAMEASDQNAIAAELGWNAVKVCRYMKTVAAKLRAAVNPE